MISRGASDPLGTINRKKGVGRQQKLKFIKSAAKEV